MQWYRKGGLETECGINQFTKAKVIHWSADQTRGIKLLEHAMKVAESVF